MIESMKDLKKLNDKELIDCLFDFYTNDYEDKTNFDSSSVMRYLSLSASDDYVLKLGEYLNGKVFNEDVGNYQDSIHNELCVISYQYFKRHAFNVDSNLDISTLNENTYDNIFSLYNKLENVLMSRKEFYSNFNEEFKDFIKLILETKRMEYKKNDYGINRLYDFIQTNNCFNENFKYYKKYFIENSDLLNYKNNFKILVDNANHILFSNNLLLPVEDSSYSKFNGVIDLIDCNEKPDGLKLLMYEDFYQRSFKVFKKILMDEEKYNYLKSKIDVKDIEKFDYFFVSSYLDNIIKDSYNLNDIKLEDVFNNDFFNYIFKNKQKEVLNYFEKNIGNVFHGNGIIYTYKLLNSYILNKFVLFIAENDKKSTNEKENIFDSFINVISTYQGLTGLTDFKIYKNKSIGQIASEKKGVLSKILKNNMFSSREDVLNEVNYFEYFVQNYGFELLKKETFFDFSKIQENSIKVKETDYFDNNEYLVNIYKNVISDIFESNNMFKIEDDKITYLIQEFQFSYLFNIFKNKEFLEKNNLLNGLMKELNSIKEIDINNLVSFAKNNLINNNLLNKKNLKLLDNYSNMIEDFNLFFYPNLKNKSSKKIKL